MRTRTALPGRVAVISVHTSPLEQPGTGDAGGMNVYIRQTATRMAARGVPVDVFTRATAPGQPPSAELAPGVTVRHVLAGPPTPLAKEALPDTLGAFTDGVLTAAARAGVRYDVVHSHYWLSGVVGDHVARRWRVPFVHSAHTLAKVKNAALAAGDPAEPSARLRGEQQIADDADRLVANTDVEAAQLTDLYGAAADRVLVITPGVDLDVFTPGDRDRARAALGIGPDALVLGFVGRIQPLKAPDVLLRAVADLLAAAPGLRERLVVLVVGGPSGSGLDEPAALAGLARELGVADRTRFLPPTAGAGLADLYRAMDVLAVPSYNESFGLVALEAQACGTPVAAARVGGLPVAVADGRTGVLVDGHRTGTWRAALAGLLANPVRRQRFAANAVRHATRFSWERTADALLRGYRVAAGDPFDEGVAV